MFFRNYGELEYVMAKTTPEFEKLVEDKGFKLIAWTTAGWVRFFGKGPIVYPDDLRRQKLAVSAEDAEILYTWRAMNFDALPLHTTEILAGLQSGMAEAFHTPPIVAAVYQWFGLANHMSSLDMAPLIAGLVMGERSWRKIPRQYHEDFLAAAQEVLKPLYEEVEVLEAEVIEIMKENGLVVDDAPPEALAEWESLVGKAQNVLVGTSISPETYEKVKRFRDEYRASEE
jgi:TRAP-type C4-dicarboxylate transport system substrate-binding protein